MNSPQHIAYEVSLDALRNAKQIAVQDFLSQNDCYDPEDLDDMNIAIRCIDQAFDLCEQAEKIATQMMQSSDHSKAISQLSKRRPGFPEETYAKAMHEAIYRLAR